MPSTGWYTCHMRDPLRGRRGTCSPSEVCGRRLSSRQETRVRRRSSSSVPQAGCTSAQRRHCRRSQKPLWPRQAAWRLRGKPRANGQPTLCPTPVPRVGLTRCSDHAAPSAAGAESGGSRRAMVAVPAVHAGPAHTRMRQRGCTRRPCARSPQPVPMPMPMPVPMPVPTAVPVEPHSRRALMAPLLPWRAPRPPSLGLLRPQRAACTRARPEGSASRPWPHATRHTPHATRHTRRRPARRHLQARRAQPHPALRRRRDLPARDPAGQEALPLRAAASEASSSEAVVPATYTFDSATVEWAL